MFKKEQAKEIELWRIESAKRDQARRERGLWEIPEGEVDEYTKRMSEAKKRYSLPYAQPCPV